jgi:hypothetical protein
LKIKDVLRPEIILEGNKELMEKNSIPKAKVIKTGGSGFGNRGVGFENHTCGEEEHWQNSVMYRLS